MILNDSLRFGGEAEQRGATYNYSRQSHPTPCNFAPSATAASLVHPRLLQMTRVSVAKGCMVVEEHRLERDHWNEVHPLVLDLVEESRFLPDLPGAAPKKSHEDEVVAWVKILRHAKWRKEVVAFCHIQQHFPCQLQHAFSG